MRMVDIATRERLVAALAQVRPRNWRTSLRVVDGCEVVFTILQAPVDPIAFLARAAALRDATSAAASDLQIAHARRYCRPVRIPALDDIEQMVGQLPEHLVEAGRVLARMDAALRAPGVDSQGKPAEGGNTFPVRFQIGSGEKPFQVVAPKRADAPTASMEPVGDAVAADGDEPEIPAQRISG